MDEDQQRQVLKTLLAQLRSVPDPAICVGFPAATERISRKHYWSVNGKYVEKAGANVASKRRLMASSVLPPETEPIDINTFGDSVLTHNGRVVVAEFDEMKGFEFSSVVLVNLDDDHLYPNWVPKDEYWRIAFQTYVAMTRARDHLWLLTASPTSSILDCSSEFVDQIAGPDFLARVADQEQE